MAIFQHQGDLPAEALAGATSVAVDSETLGLRLGRDPLCVVQLSDGSGDAHVVQLDRTTYDCPNLKRLLTDPAVTKIFHFGRFDIAMFWLHLGVVTAPVYCTKIASKLARTYTDRHGLKDLCAELLGIDLSKQQQSSDWAAEKLSDQQKHYAASDVLHLHALKGKLDAMLQRAGRMAMADRNGRAGRRSRAPVIVRIGLNLKGLLSIRGVFARPDANRKTKADCPAARSGNGVCRAGSRATAAGARDRACRPRPSGFNRAGKKARTQA